MENNQVSQNDPGLFGADADVSSGTSESPAELANEFVWLFEYGLEMDAAFLNSRERLDGAALFYGPAVLKGYQITFDAVRLRTGQVVATVVPDHEYGAEVWGVLYRVPRRLVGWSGNDAGPGNVQTLTDQPSLLDKAHPYFEPLNVVVYETYRKREVTAIAYMASVSARRQFHLLFPARQVVDGRYAKRLLESARQHKLPDAYVQELLARSALKTGTQSVQAEQNTEPLTAVMGKARSRIVTQAAGGMADTVYQRRWLMAFALYLVVLLLGVLTLAVLQGLAIWSDLLTAHFAPLGVPWFVLVYGLLGGCVSSINMLGRRHAIDAPAFVLVTWFARPYLGMILAALAYLALSSGFVVLGGSTPQYNAVCSLVGALAGLCEGWVFYRRM